MAIAKTHFWRRREHQQKKRKRSEISRWETIDVCDMGLLRTFFFVHWWYPLFSVYIEWMSGWFIYWILEYIPSDGAYVHAHRAPIEMRKKTKTILAFRFIILAIQSVCPSIRNKGTSVLHTKYLFIYCIFCLVLLPSHIFLLKWFIENRNL